MAEKRNPEFVFLLKYKGKKKSNKVELFAAEDFGYKKSSRERNYRYRLRVNGKWHGRKGEYFTKWQIRDLLWRSIIL